MLKVLPSTRSTFASWASFVQDLFGPFASTFQFQGARHNTTPGLNAMSGDLDNVFALSGELRNDREAERDNPARIFAISMEAS